MYRTTATTCVDIIVVEGKFLIKLDAKDIHKQITRQHKASNHKQNTQTIWQYKAKNPLYQINLVNKTVESRIILS